MPRDGVQERGAGLPAIGDDADGRLAVAPQLGLPYFKYVDFKAWASPHLA